MLIFFNLIQLFLLIQSQFAKNTKRTGYKKYKFKTNDHMKLEILEKIVGKILTVEVKSSNRFNERFFLN